jgi:hypothetical protein
MPENLIVEKLAYESEEPNRGFTVKCYYLTTPKGEALIEIYRDGEPYRRFLYPAYKIWNIAAHFDDIVTSEIDGDSHGYDLAGWTGFAVVHPQPVE